MSSYQCLFRFYSEINGGGKNYNIESKTCWDILYCFENQLNFHVIFQVLGNYDANTATIGLMILLCQLFFASLLILFVIQKAKKQVEYLSSNQSNNVLEVITVIK